MSRKRKDIVLEHLEIASLEFQGKGVARHQSKVVFVEGALPGDVVDVKLVQNKKDYAIGRIVAHHRHSSERQQPFCKHFGLCGGCKWQSLSYQRQLHYKEHFVKDAMQHIGRLNDVNLLPIVGCESDTYFRNKLEFAFSNQRWLTDEEKDSGAAFNNRDALGFHIAGWFDKVLNIEHCHLQPEPSNAIRNFVNRYAAQHQLAYFDIRKQQGLLRNLLIRTSATGEVMVVFSFFRNDENEINALLEALKNNFPQITSLNYVINYGANDIIHPYEVVCYRGKPFITEQLGHVSFKIGPKSFFQTNTSQAKRLYDIVVDFAALQGNETVYDLYTGIGSIALYIAGRCRKVVGIEQIPDAIADAEENAQLNNITNTAFFTGDVRDMFNNDFYNTHGAPQLVITDPPRSGMHVDVVKTFLEFEVPRIVYVSCNPATQARDLLLLSEKYEVAKMQPVDMFPQTYHIESVALLELKK
jgi:23S rRNA (uracil1939-C5)-methyltransferase